MDPRKDLQNCLNTCQQNADKLRALAQTESSQTARDLLLDAAHHLDVAIVECNYTQYNL
ncbi:MAG: hypothetical protein ACM3X6_14120 [Patescibacteria group bacterium]